MRDETREVSGNHISGDLIHPVREVGLDFSLGKNHRKILIQRTEG